MPINLEQWSAFGRSKAVADAYRKEFERWGAMTPAEREAEQKAVDARWEKARKHIAFLDFCVAKKIEPNLVLPVQPKR